MSTQSGTLRVIVCAYVDAPCSRNIVLDVRGGADECELRAETASAELERRRMARATDPQAFMLDAPVAIPTPSDTASHELQRRRA